MKTLFALYGITMSYNLSAVGGLAFYDTDKSEFKRGLELKTPRMSCLMQKTSGATQKND